MQIRDASELHFFVILVVGVHAPDVMMRAEQVLDRQHGRNHRVILVVVLVHAVAAGNLEILERIQVRPNHGEGILVSLVVHGVGLRHPHNRSAYNFR